MRSICALTAVLALANLATLAPAGVVMNQQPVSGGGVSRWSQLWQDPGPNGNDLDGDSVCWADFTLTAATTINHIEWWGTGACELGFRIEFWRQDPNTIAYQPLAVFYYGYHGEGDPPVSPEPGTIDQTTSYSTSPGPGGLAHHVLNLASPVTLAANDSSNPRWFIGIIGLTSQAYVTWNWAQSIGTHHTYQFVRGGYEGGGDIFRPLGDGRALVLADARGDLNCDGSVNFDDIDPFVLALSNAVGYQTLYPNCDLLNADCNRDGVATFDDINAFVATLGGN